MSHRSISTPVSLLHLMPLEGRCVSGRPDNAVVSVVDDSREIQQGCLFVARQATFVKQAIQAGAAAILVSESDWAVLQGQIEEFKKVGKTQDDLGLAIWVVAQVDQAICAQVAGAFWYEQMGSKLDLPKTEALSGQQGLNRKHPGAYLKLMGVTGTNGKTTIASLIQHNLNQNNVRCGLIGTVVTDTCGADGPKASQLTTPGAVELCELLGQMVANGCQACVMEVSSHALDQNRVAELMFDVGVFTNLTQDHLDYHQTMTAYAQSKAKLFSCIKQGGTAVINVDDPASEIMIRAAQSAQAVVMKTSLLDKALEDPSTCVAQVKEQTIGGTLANWIGPWGVCESEFPVAGKHNLSNALQAACASYAIEGFDHQYISNWIKQAPPVPGRLEPIPNVNWPLMVGSDEGNGDQIVGRPDLDLPAVFVDYAHTPDAVANVLAALKPLVKGRLVVVLGCGGDRDPGKRPLMAQVACELADQVVLTSDNPRTEDPNTILSQMVAGLNEKGLTPLEDEMAIQQALEAWPQQTVCYELGEGAVKQRVWVEVDRSAAIGAAILQAQVDDTIVIAGKGHEDYQIIGTTKIDFDDRRHAVDALNKRARVSQI